MYEINMKSIGAIDMSNLFASSQFTFWNWFSILFFLLSGLCKDVSLSLPFFGSQPNTYRAQVGNSVTLFCQVENLGKFKNTLYWEKFDITLMSFKVRGQKVIFFYIWSVQIFCTVFTNSLFAHFYWDFYKINWYFLASKQYPPTWL